MKHILFLLLTISGICNAKSSSASASAAEADVKMTDVEGSSATRGTKRKTPTPETEPAEGDVKMGDAENPYEVRKKAKKTGWQSVLPDASAEAEATVAAQPANRWPAELEKEIHQALEARDFAKLEKIIKNNPAVVNMVDARGNNLLMNVLLSPHSPEQVVTELIKLTKDVNHRNYLEETPLMLAARKGTASSVDQLLKRGASIDARDDDGDTPLMSAMEQQIPQVVMTLLKHGAYVKNSNNFGETALHYAINWGVPPGQKPTEPCDICKRVHFPSPEHQAKTVELLLQRGADINAIAKIPDEGIFGQTPLIRAIELGNFPVVQLLLSKRANINMIDPDHIAQTDPISLAVWQRISRQTDPEIHKGLTPQQRALFYEANFQIIKLLLAAGASPQRALQLAIENEQAEIVKLLLIQGAIPGAAHQKALNDALASINRETPFRTKQALATIRNMLTNPEIIKEEIATRETQRKEQTGLAQATIQHQILQEQPEIAESILEFIGGSNTEPGKTTEQVQYINNIKVALRRNNNAFLTGTHPEHLKLTDNDGNTPLLLALHYQKKEGAIPYTKAGDNALNAILTSLHAADKVEEGKKQRLKQALEHKNKQGYDALDLARALELNSEVIERLESERKSAGL
jgi:ankyrin repeat protein